MKTLLTLLGLLLYAQPTLIPATISLVFSVVSAVVTVIATVTTSPWILAVAVGAALTRVLYRAITPQVVHVHA